MPFRLLDKPTSKKRLRDGRTTCHAFCALFLIMGAALPTPGAAQDTPGISPDTKVATAPPPAPTQAPTKLDSTPRSSFVYQLGKTTLDEARAYWSQNGMKVLRAAHMAVGTGSGADGVGRVAAEKVLLVDVSGVDFEGVSTARFGFYENTLYRLQAPLRSNPLGDDIRANYSEEQIRELRERLVKKYGSPSEAHRTVFADQKSGNDLLIWKLRDDNVLILSLNLMNSSLVLTNERMEVEVKSYVKDYCKTVNTKGHIICW